MSRPEGNQRSEEFEKRDLRKNKEVERVEIDTGNPIASAIGRANFVIGKGDRAVDQVESSMQGRYQEGRKTVDEAAGNATREAGEFLGEKLGKMAKKGVEAIAPAPLKKIAGKAIEKGAEKLGGYLAEEGVSEDIANATDFIGSHHIANEINELTETMEQAAVVKGVVKGVRMGVEKLGKGAALAGFEKAMGKLVNDKVYSKLRVFARGSFMKKFLTRVGIKGAFALAAFSNPLPTIDKLIALGAAGLMAKDFYDLSLLIKKAIQISDAIEDMSTRPINEIRGLDDVSQKTIDETLEFAGKSMEDMSNVEKIDFIKSLPDVKIKITYAGSTDHQIYRFVQGEVFAAEIKKGEEIFELTDQELNQDVALPPPQNFKKIKIDYKNDKDIPAKHQYALLNIKNAMGWTKLDYDLVDDSTIQIKRLDGQRESTTIVRSGKKWRLPHEFVGGFDLEQAVIMANLLNKVKGIIKKGGEVGASEKPFYEDHGAIMFDRNNNFWNNLDVLSEGQWQAFFKSENISTDTSKVEKYKIIQMLNNWYQQEMN